MVSLSAQPSPALIPSRAIFNRSDGLFRIMVTSDDGEAEREVYQARGYAGNGIHRNSPGASHLVGLGPLPAGEYHVGLPHRHPRLGPLAFRLRPHPGNMMFGRSGFYVHGDNGAGNASKGCVILAWPHREAMVEYRVRHLTVT